MPVARVEFLSATCIALAAALCLAACSSPSPTPTPTATSLPPATPTTAPSREPETPTVEAKGYILYIPGISAIPPFSDFQAKRRAEQFISDKLMDLIESQGFSPAWFSYKSTGGYGGPETEYSHADTRRHLEASAAALDEQVRGLIRRWQGEIHPTSMPEIVIAAHSLGGAVAARWAFDADVEVLDAVRTVFTFDSPLAGVGGIRGSFGGDAGDDLTDPDELAKIAHGTSRLDFIQVGNTEDLIVSVDESYTPHGWQKLSVSCGRLTDIGDHLCSMEEPASLTLVDAALNGSPPLWSGLLRRPGPEPSPTALLAPTGTPTETPPVIHSPTPAPAPTAAAMPTIPGVIKGDAHPGLVELWDLVDSAVQGDTIFVEGFSSVGDFPQHQETNLRLRVLLPDASLGEQLSGSQAILTSLTNPTTDLPLEDRAVHLYNRLYCPVCPGETIEQAKVPLAEQMREIVYEKLAAGEQEPAILAFFVERFGSAVLAPVRLELVRVGGIDFNGWFEFESGLSLQLGSAELLVAHSSVRQAEEYIEPLLEGIGKKDVPLAFWFSSVNSELSDDQGLPVLVLRYDIPDDLEETRTLFSEVDPKIRTGG